MNKPSSLASSPSTPSTDQNEVLVKVEGVSKKFCRSLKKSLWYGVCDIAGELNPFARNVAGDGRSKIEDGSLSQLPTSISRTAQDEDLRPGEFYAVRDVSFELRRGECLGLIGRNGAGKTTLLKMLNGLIKPDSGKITMRGRIGALIALGAGFNPILTGRENIYVNGSVLGLSKREIEEKIEEIIDFAEVREFIDAPVRNYSSGMSVRLGFAVASALDPDVLIIDEVLAVGDIGFRTKCYNRVYQLCKTSAVIFVSHSMPQIDRLCTSGCVLDQGKICYLGDTGHAIDRYNHLFSVNSSQLQLGKGVELNSTSINGISNKNHIIFNGGDSLVIEISLSLPAGIEQIEVSLTIHDPSLDLITHANSRHGNSDLVPVHGQNVIKIIVPNLCLGDGPKPITLTLRNRETNEILVWASAAWELQVKNVIYVPAPMYSEAIFNIASV